MTHPPYGDDARERGPGGDAAPPAQGRHAQPPDGEPLFGPPSSGQQPAAPGGQPPFGPSPYGPPQYGAALQQGQQSPYGPPPQYDQRQYGQSQYGRPPYAQPPYGQPPYAQSPYGQPQHGPGGWAPQPPPARRSGRPLLLVLALVALVLLVGAALLLVPGMRTAALDPQAVQREVAEQFQEREGVAVQLRCGDDMTVEAGSTYECSGTTADGEAVTITIAIIDEDANYTWDGG